MSKVRRAEFGTNLEGDIFDLPHDLSARWKQGDGARGQVANAIFVLLYGVHLVKRRACSQAGERLSDVLRR